MPPREFIDIALQVLGRHLVVDTDEASLLPRSFQFPYAPGRAHTHPRSGSLLRAAC